MGIGPVEYAIIAFPGNEFKGEIAPALAELVESNTIRLIDLAFVTKDADGATAAMELSDLDSEIGRAIAAINHEVGGLLNEEDLQAAADELEPNSSAALLVWEDVWATRFVEACRNANGILLDHDRLPAEVVEAAIDFAKANA